MRPYPFVGRHRETAWVRTELEAGRSLVLTGAYGIGRTSLVKHLAREMAREWSFVVVDFDRAPAAVWLDLFAAIFPRAWKRLRAETLSMKWTRFRVLSRKPEDSRRHALVLDNLARLSPQRLDLVRRLRERHQVLAIVEDFLPEPAKAELCAALWAHAPLRLGHLSLDASVAYFEACNRTHGFGWGRGELRGLVRATGGFPLGMREAVAAELRRRERAGGRAPLARA